MSSTGLNNSARTGSPPRTPDRSRPGTARRSTDTVTPHRQRAATLFESHRPNSRRIHHGLSAADDILSSNSRTNTGFQGLEGPPTANGDRQTLQEFLQGLDIDATTDRQNTSSHRHSIGNTAPDTSRLRERERRFNDRLNGRRRSTQTHNTESRFQTPAESDRSGGPAIPSTPPPSYERYERRGQLGQEEGRDPHPGRRVSVDDLTSSMYLKPKWQSDHEVSECPICGRSFSFFFRKHHCRKCGRVVCANCSPHRITIPKQYIVEPPAEGGEGEQEETLRAETSGDNDGQIFGGQEVRLCNPCVPDPNPLPPPDYNVTPQNILSTFPPQDFAEQPNHVPARQYPRSSFQRDWIGPYNASNAGVLPRQRSATESYIRAQYSPTGLRTPNRRRTGFEFLEPNSNGPEPTPDWRSQRRQGYHGHRHRPAASTGALPPQWQFEHPRDAPLPPQPVEPPRRQVAEEDECPVCHEELPPKGPNGDEAAREVHVSECIASHSASGAGETPITPTGAAISHTISSSAPSAGWHAPDSRNRSDSTAARGAFPAPASRPSRPRADTAFASTSSAPVRRRANMLVYHATEKDCLDAEGRPRECIICLDEFVEGAELGRLECWCVFHRTCIREWWDQKGPGACPTHQTGI